MISNHPDSFYQILFRQFSSDSFKYEQISISGTHIFDDNWHMLTFVKKGMKGWKVMKGRKGGEGM